MAGSAGAGGVGSRDPGAARVSEAEAPTPTPAAKPRRRQSGIATADVVQSAHLGGNAELFPQVLALHVPDGATVADVT